MEDLHIAATYNVVCGSPFSFVEQEVGYFLITGDWLAPVLDLGICFLPLAPVFPIKYALVWKKHAIFSKAAKKFYEEIKN